MGTCELRCGSDAECPADHFCQTEPPPDGLHHVCVDGPRDTLSSIVLVDLEHDDGGYVLAGEAIEVGRRYVLVGEADAATALATEDETQDCDHCLRPRYRAQLLDRAEAPILALGPVHRALRDARATDVGEHGEPGREWRREVSVDVDGDGRDDLEGVVRCGHYIPSGCSDEVCDRVCRGTRTLGEAEARGLRCRDFIPDVDDCEPAD